MAATSAIMAFSAVTEGVNTYQKTSALKAQSEQEQNALKFNAEVADFQSSEAIKRGEVASAKIARDTKRLRGAQRAAYAAQGIDVGSESAQDVMAESEQMGAVDELTVKNNAWLEAWGYEAQAQELRQRSSYAKVKGENEVTNTLLTGGLRFINSGLRTYSAMNGPSAKTKVPTRRNNDVSVTVTE